MAPRRHKESRDPLSQRVRRLRQKKGWTLEDLSASSGVSRSMLSQIERGRANPTVAVAQRIAHAFGTNIGDLVDAPPDGRSIEVIRGGDKEHHFRSGGGCRIRTLSPLHREKDVEFYELRLSPGEALRSAPHFAGTRELLTVVQGKARVTSGPNSADLSTGDSAHYVADVRHAIENAGTGELVAYLVDVNRRP